LPTSALAGPDARVSERYGLDVAPDRVGSLLDRWVTERPDAAAVITPERSWSYAELDSAVGSLAAALHAAGVRRDDVVPLVDVGGAFALATILAAARIGAAAAPMNPRYTAAELRTLREIGGACSVAAAGQAYRAHLDGAVVGPESMAAGDDHVADAGDTAVILFTSGTTGLPKSVPVRTATLLARLAPYADAPQHQVRMLCVPIHHVGGLIGALVSLVGGHSLVVQTRFDPAEWLQLVEQHGVQLTFVVPTMLARIADHPDLVKRDLSSLQTVTYGASPMPEDLVVKLTTALPGVGLVNTFGQTETLGGITLSTPEDHHHPVHRTSVGKLVPGVQIRIVDPDTGDAMPTGAVGELLVESAQNVTEDWQRTGDLVRVDDDGYLYVHGRLSDTINRGGEKFGPIEVETVLRDHPAVRDVAVAGVPDPELHERVGAVVVVDGDVTVDELQQFCVGKLARYKTPERVAFVDEVPLTDLGKVDRRAVTRLLMDGEG
jgi:long-chain acyl-CoA synthetase